MPNWSAACAAMSPTMVKVISAVVEAKREEGAKFSDYFDFFEPLKQIPSHRALAMFRGRTQGVLDLKIEVGDPAHRPATPVRGDHR